MKINNKNHAENGSVVKFEDTENAEDVGMKVEFEKWKSKTYALTVPLRIVALCNSVPPAWFKVCFINILGFINGK